MTSEPVTIQSLQHPTRFQQWRFRNIVRRRLPLQFVDQSVRVADELLLYAQRSSREELKDLIAESTDPNHVLV